MGICKPLGSLNSFLSYVLQVSGTTSCFLIVTSLIPCSPWGMAEDSCFLHSSELLCNHCRGGSICWVTGIVFPFGSPHSHLEAPNHWWLWHFLLVDMAAGIFISHYLEIFMVYSCTGDFVNAVISIDLFLWLVFLCPIFRNLFYPVSSRFCQ